MKRTISMLLLSALLLGLLGGCAAQLTPTEPTSEPATEPATLAPPKEYTVTPGGVAVNTSYDAYTIRDRKVTPRFTRLSDDPMPELTARDDYGALYPYVGGVTDAGYMTSPVYGFADAKGRLVTDPVYSAINQARNDDGTQCIWLFRQIHLTEYIDADGVSYPDGEEYLGFATPDGSFATDCRYGRIYTADSFLLCVYPTDTNADEVARFDVYNYTGTLLTTSADLPYGDRLGSYYWQLDCIGDLLVIPLRNGEFEDWDNGTQRENTDLYLFTLDGDQVAGPFDYLYSRSGGYVCVEQADQTSAVLKPDGSFMFGRSFYSINLDAPDRFTVKSSQSDDYHVIDAEGNEIFTIPGNDYLYWEGSYYVTSSENDNANTFLDRDGNLIEGVQGGDWNPITGTRVFSRTSGTTTTFRNIVTGQEMTKELGIGGYVASCTYRDGTEFPYFVVVSGSERDSYLRMDTAIYNEQLEAVLTFRGNCYTVYDSSDDTTPYLVVNVNNELTFYDANLTPQFTVPGNLRNGLSLNNGILTCYDDRASYVYDMTGKQLICYPLYSLLDD